MTSIPHPHSGTATVDADGSGLRLDQWLAQHQPDLSRARWQELIKTGQVKLNGKSGKPHHSVQKNDHIEFTIPAPTPARVKPEAIPLNILFEDEHLLVINKPPGLVVHPAPGHASGTLVNALLHHCRDLAGIGGTLRPGIVHRLDRDTSGVLVVAKSDRALTGLAEQFKRHQVEKEYLALVWGHPQPASGRIETLIGRHPVDRKKMSASPLPPTHQPSRPAGGSGLAGREGWRARPRRGRPAITQYSTMEKFKEISLLSVRIQTGRTHQIRVHLAHLGHPVVGDHQYGRPRKNRSELVAHRQMLHAHRLAFTHPILGHSVEFVAPLPEDFQQVVRTLH